MAESLSSTVLLLGIFNAAIVATLLLLKRSFKPATLILVIFIILLIARSVLYVLGRESLFDPHSWLYVPLTEVSLAYGPCVYLYLVYSIKRKPQVGDLLHFAPVLVQVSYYLSLLLLPKSTSVSLLETFHNPIFTKIEAMAVMISLGCYLLLTSKAYHRYQLWLDQFHSDAEEFRMDWLRIFLIAISVFFLVLVIFTLRNFWIDQTFKADLGLFAFQSLLLCLLALESWRNADIVFPIETTLPNVRGYEPTQLVQTIDSNIVCKDRNQLRATEWINTLKQNQWWREPHLTLAGLAVKLGTNSASLSAAINQQCGENFNAAINRLRVEYVCEKITQAPEKNGLLELAYEAGFNSKNSFNRNFRRFTGYSPTEFKQQLSTKS